MKDQLAQLIRLQDMDKRLQHLRAETSAIPQRLEVSQKSFDEAKKRLAQSQADVEALNRQRRDKERDLETRETQLTKTRDRQSEIKTNKEYQAHLHEIETLIFEKGRVEEDLLLLMEQIDQHKRKEAELLQAVQSAEREFDSVKRQLEQKAEALKSELTSVEKEREAVTAILAPNLLKMYQNIKNLRRGLAVVPIQNGTCGGCHMNLPPQLVAEVKIGDRIITCSQCLRVLYWPAPAERPAEVTGTGPV